MNGLLGPEGLVLEYCRALASKNVMALTEAEKKSSRPYAAKNLEAGREAAMAALAKSWRRD
jgi:hypothetical protein